jgi:hypothetical protein
MAGDEKAFGNGARIESGDDRSDDLTLAARERVGTAEKVMGWIEYVQEIGGLALAQGDVEQAAALLSASERLRTEHSVRLWDPADWEENLIKLQAKMSTKIFTAAWQAGALLDERDAIAAALDYNASVTSESVSSSTA